MSKIVYKSCWICKTFCFDSIGGLYSKNDMLLSLEVLMNSIYYFNILIGDVKSYYRSLEVG